MRDRGCALKGIQTGPDFIEVQISGGQVNGGVRGRV